MNRTTKRWHNVRAVSQKARAKAVAALKIIPVSRELAESQILSASVSIALVFVLTGATV